MVRIQPRQRAEVEQAARREGAPRVTPPRRRNVDAVLSLGSGDYFTFRARLFHAPPLPWKAGQRLLTLLLALERPGAQLTLETAREYFAAVAQLPALLWRCTRPTGPTRRALRFLGLHRNPFADATEAELADLARFFCSCRMRSSVQLPTPTPRPAPSTS